MKSNHNGESMLRRRSPNVETEPSTEELYLMYQNKPQIRVWWYGGDGAGRAGYQHHGTKPVCAERNRTLKVNAKRYASPAIYQRHEVRHRIVVPAVSNTNHNGNVKYQQYRGKPDAA